MASLGLSLVGAVPSQAFHLKHCSNEKYNSSSRFLQSHKYCVSDRITPRRGAAPAAASGSSSSSTTSTSYWTSDLDLYEILGVDSSSGQMEIKKAYRALQKRCHPDIAGEAGHDMAILLNEIYSILSDPVARNAYDKEQAKIFQFQGYTGKPIYSAWFGSESETRAVFVDELKCVGCLKCALFANKTFAIEAIYGRARVVAQWADPEDKIIEAIQTCPVDCISMVERSNLAALEFLMSKQPRGNVRISVGNTGGARACNVFGEVTKFQRRYQEMKERESGKQSKGSDPRRESRFSAIQRIRSISNWWYWKPPAASSEAEACLILVSAKSKLPNVERLQEAAARHKKKAIAGLQGNDSAGSEHNTEYWKPVTFLPPSPSSPKATTFSAMAPSSVVALEDKAKRKTADSTITKNGRITISLIGPGMMALISAAVVASRGREMIQAQSGGLEEHIAGGMALEVVNSFEMQIVLAGVTWFIIGIAVEAVVEVILGRGGFRR